ncbi:hypothetical protein BG004_008012 [Podila humilis]|nr:hypothetical protein BG004_008012 [Podila humilis]
MSEKASPNPAFLDKLKRKLDLSIVKGIDVEDLTIDFTLEDPWTSTIASEHMTARLAAIPGLNWPIQQVQLKIVIQENGNDIGHFDSPFAPATVQGGKITSSLSQTTMQIYPQSHTEFEGFVQALATKTAHTFVIKGCANIIFDLGILGIHTLHGIDFVSDLTLRGLGNLPNISCTSAKIVPNKIDSSCSTNNSSKNHDIDTSCCSAYNKTLECVFDIQNPSQLCLTLGDCIFAVTVEGNRHIGLMSFKSLALNVGPNPDKVGTIILDTSLDAAKSLLHALELEDHKIYLKGFRNTSKNEALSAGLVTFSTSAVIPQIKII